jgi:hypothetical protein
MLLAGMTLALAPAVGSGHTTGIVVSDDSSANVSSLYAFASPDKPGTITIIANYGRFREPAGNPVAQGFNPDLDYWIKLDNNGDGTEDITYSFRFTTSIANPDSVLYTGYGPVTSTDANLTQTLDVDRNGEPFGSGLFVPPPNIGPRTTPDYAQIALNAVQLLDDGASVVFAGQRDDPSFADLGAMFDLVGLRPFNAGHSIKQKRAPGQDSLAGFNVNTVAIQVPRSALTVDGQDVTDETAPNAVVGIWAGTSVLRPDGGWTPVSRLGNPLVNDLLIPIAQKDAWSVAGPAGDAAFENRYLAPEMATVLNTVYRSLKDARTSDRSDLTMLLGQGVPGLNQTNATGVFDMLRLNLATAPKAKPKRLGLLEGDLQGFPNGRRLTDDVVDIELRAIADGYGPFVAETFGFPNLKPNNALGDGCIANDLKFSKTFPYLALPHQGYAGGRYRKPCGK